MDRALLSAVLVGLAIIEASAKLTEPRQSPVTIDIRGPIVVGFYPPPEDASDGASIEGLAHLRFALEDIAECYGNQTATYRLEVTRLLILRDGQKVHQLAIPTDRAVGIILALPGREPRIVFAEAGPSSLSLSGPSAAAEYFNALGCRQDPTDHALRARDAGLTTLTADSNFYSPPSAPPTILRRSRSASKPSSARSASGPNGRRPVPVWTVPSFSRSI